LIPEQGASRAECERRATLHEVVAKEKRVEVSLIEAESEAINTLLANFSTKSSETSNFLLVI